MNAKTMTQIENQAYRLTERNWNRKNVWDTSALSRVMKIKRDKLICRAYERAAEKHLNTLAKSVCECLSVRALPDENFDTMALEYNSPSVGMTLKIASPYSIEELLNNPENVWKILEA